MEDDRRRNALEPIFDQQASIPVDSVAVDPNAHLTVYAGTGDFADYFGSGIYKSIDGGGTWTKIGGSAFDDCAVTDLVVEPGNSSVVLASVGTPGNVGATSCGSRRGVWRSTTGWTSWTHLLSRGGSDLEVDPGTPATMYAGVLGTGVWKSTKAGATWKRLGGGLPTSNIDKTVVSVAPSNSQRVYAAIARADNFKLLGIYTSGDGGSTWTKLTAPSTYCSYTGDIYGQCWYDLALQVDPTNASTVYAGGVNLYRATNPGGGYTFTKIAPRRRRSTPTSRGWRSTRARVF